MLAAGGSETLFVLIILRPGGGIQIFCGFSSSSSTARGCNSEPGLALLRGTLCGDRVQEGSDQERMEGGRKDSGWQVSLSYLDKIQFNWTMKTTWMSVIVVELSYYHSLKFLVSWVHCWRLLMTIYNLRAVSHASFVFAGAESNFLETFQMGRFQNSRSLKISPQ